MADEKAELRRIAQARSDRTHHAVRINRFYDLAAPYRVRVASAASRSLPNPQAQDDIFDKEFQISVADFAADHADFFCPDYKPWVKTKAGLLLSTAEERQFKEQLKPWEARLYDLIRQTDFYEQVYEILYDLAGSAGGVNIPYQPPTRPVRCQPILMANLLFDEGPYNDLDGRWHEFHVKKSDLKVVFPGVDFAVAQVNAKRDDQFMRIIQGVTREWPEVGEPTWSWSVFADNKRVFHKTLVPGEPPQIAIARWRHSPPSAWGPGPADLAIAAAQTLDELAFINLKKLGKEADPPFSYEVDGVFNPEGGVDPGTYIGRRVGSKAPEPLFEPTNSQNLYFDREALRMTVKRALYQDSPTQRGETPPTATQWLGEEAINQRRARVRRRVYREFVLPVLQRFVWVFAARGELQPLRLDGNEVGIEFVSPLSKASDAEEVSSGVQFISSAVGIFGETALASIDAEQTMRNWQDKLGDTTVEIISPDSQKALVQRILSEGRNIVNNG